jgi:hypothetical protein
MANPKKEPSLVERLVLEHNEGSVPHQGALDSPEKIRAYVERVKAATEEGLKADRRARQESALKARARHLD